MYCSICQTDVTLEQKFCKNCGAELIWEKAAPPAKITASNIIHQPVVKSEISDEYLAEKCRTCGLEGGTKFVKFYYNIGFLVARQWALVEGNLCFNCINRYFWKYTLITFFLGWWGTISFFVTPFILLQNIGRYIWALI